MGFLPGVPDDVPGSDEGDRAGVPGRGLDAFAAPGLRRRRGDGPFASRWVGPKVALAAVAVYAAGPVSPSFQIAYTESLAILLLCGFLWAVSTD